MNKISALLIGVPYYDSPHISNLELCSSDASGVYGMLKQNLLVNESAINIYGSHPTQRVTRVEILRAINHLIDNIDEDDLLFFYFSGHGSLVGQENYLISSDTEVDLVEDTSVSISKIYEKLKAVKAKYKLIVIDSCHSGVFTKSLSRPPNFENDYYEGVQIFASSKADEESFIEHRTGRSIFTHYFISGLQGEAVEENETSVTISQLNKYVSRKLRNWSRRNNKIQTPTLKGETAGELVFYIEPRVRTDKNTLVSSGNNISKLSDFRDYMNSVLNYKQSTIDLYANNFAKVLAHFEPELDWKDIFYNRNSNLFLIKFLSGLTMSDRGKHQFVSAYIAFGKCVGVAVDRPKELRKTKNNTSPFIPLDETLVEDVISSVHNNKYQLLLRLLYNCALKGVEVQKIKVNDIDTDSGYLIIVNSKNIVKKVYFDESLLPLIKREMAGKSPFSYLLEGAKNGEAISTRMMQHIVASTFMELSERKVNPSMLKKSRLIHQKRSRYPK